VPVIFMAYDILEDDGRDIRRIELATRRARLEALLAPDAASADGPGRSASGLLRISPLVNEEAWEKLASLRGEARARGVEGLMLKRRSSPYGVGRRRGDWWKWKADPFTIDAVLIYAQPGSGKRASLLTDYTFGVWDGERLVPIAKAYSGLTNEEIAELDRWIRRNTRERYGPVRHVDPVQVFELGFEAIARSSRHTSGIALRFPRMRRWRRDKLASQADSLDGVHALLEGVEPLR
jgi:DNA ligase-1